MAKEFTTLSPLISATASESPLHILLVATGEGRAEYERAIRTLFPRAILEAVIGSDADYSAIRLGEFQLVILAGAQTEWSARIEAECNRLGIPWSTAASPASLLPPEESVEDLAEVSKTNWVKVSAYLIAAFCLMVTGHIILSFTPLVDGASLAVQARDLFIGPFGIFVLSGFLAQLIDGSLGMGYGLVSATCLTSAGIPPVGMSATIHTAEILTTGISGYSHYRFGNVNKKLFRHLVIPGVFGAALGAVSLVLLGDRVGKWLLPLVSMYALFLGVLIILRALQLNRVRRKTTRVGLLAWVGGFLDSFGGGGWGPIVTSTLLAGGRSAKYTIGSVGLTEFFITLTSAFTFFIFAGTAYWPVIAGLIVGGLIAAPLGARLAGRLPVKPLLICVGSLAILWSLRNILKVFYA